MSNDKKRLKLIEELNRSDFLNELLVNEYTELVENNSFNQNHLHINTAFIVENEYEYEVGIYITNNSNKELLIRDIPLAIRKDNRILKEKILSIEKSFKAFEAVYIEVKFDKSDFKEPFDVDSVTVEFGNVSEINKSNYIKINFEGIEKVRDKAGYSEIKKFLKGLSIMEEDQLAIDIFKSGEIEEGFFIIALFRNSSKEEVKIKSIPLMVYNPLDLLVYKGVFNISDDSLLLQPNTGRLMVITIPRDEFPIVEGEELDKYKIYIK